MQIPLKVNEIYFFDIKHGLTMTGQCLEYLRYITLVHSPKSKSLWSKSMNSETTKGHVMLWMALHY